MEIKAYIRSTPNGYGFGRDWTFVIEKDGIPRTFWLGQAEKYCQRMYGVRSHELLQQNDGEYNDSEKLAWFIIDQLHQEMESDEIAMAIYHKAESWELSCE